jgi:hypothetical protein
MMIAQSNSVSQGVLGPAVLRSRVRELRREIETLHFAEVELLRHIASAIVGGSIPSDLAAQRRSVRERLEGLYSGVSYLEELLPNDRGSQ